jgi:hypothetical protein
MNPSDPIITLQTLYEQVQFNTIQLAALTQAIDSLNTVVFQLRHKAVKAILTIGTPTLQ